MQTEKEEVKLSIFPDDMILYLKVPKGSIIKLLDLMNTFGKVAGYKMNIEKSVVFLYTNNKLRKKIENLIHNSLKKNLEVNLTKEVKNLYNENYKTLEN
jgi:hypothetical protein